MNLTSNEIVTHGLFSADLCAAVPAPASINAAIKIVNTLIREKYISTLQHAADMGIELYKAELSIKYGFKYIQDKDLVLN